MPYSSHQKHSATSQQTMPFPDSRFVFDKRKTIHYHHLKFKIVIKRVEKRSVWYIWLRRQLNDRIMCANGALPEAQWPACIGWLSWMFLALYQSAKSLFSSFAQCFFSVLICVWSLFICFLVFFFHFGFCGNDDVVLPRFICSSTKRFYLSRFGRMLCTNSEFLVVFHIAKPHLPINRSQLRENLKGHR